MTRLTIDISDEVRRKLEARATEGGFESLEQYAQALLHATAEDGADDVALGDLIDQRLNDTRPGIEFTPEWAEQFRDQVRRRRESRGAQP